MFQSEQLLYIQMQKTGSSHIASLLSNLFEGERIGTHNAANEEQINSNRLLISSIRNPWDWYLSLWTYGVQGSGVLMRKLTRRNLLSALISAIRNPKKNYTNLIHTLSKDITLCRDVYDRSDNVESFRKWLMLVLNPNNSHWLGEDYGNTVITNLCGFMTYRYLYLCCSNVRELKNSNFISNFSDLVQFEKSNCYIDYFIRQESLEDDLCKVVEKVRPLTQEEKDLIYDSRKKNISKRSLFISDYYDKESIELIRLRES